MDVYSARQADPGCAKQRHGTGSGGNADQRWWDSLAPLRLTRLFYHLEEHFLTGIWCFCRFMHKSSSSCSPAPPPPAAAADAWFGTDVLYCKAVSALQSVFFFCGSFFPECSLCLQRRRAACTCVLWQAELAAVICHTGRLQLTDVGHHSPLSAPQTQAHNLLLIFCEQIWSIYVVMSFGLEVNKSAVKEPLHF